MKECKICGGYVTEVRPGVYRCNNCGNEMQESDFAPRPRRTYGARTAPSAGATAQLQQESGADVFASCANSVMELTCRYTGCTSAGSGYLVDMDGYGITNTHVVTNEEEGYAACDRVQVKIAGETVYARVIALGDPRGGHGSGIDLALIKLERVPNGAKPVTFGDFEKVRIGETVYVVGNSLGYGTCITRGIVSDRSRMVDGHNLMMTDCAVNGGNSGGPIFNEHGEVIATVVSGITRAEGMNFGIRGDDVQAFLKRAHPSR